MPIPASEPHWADDANYTAGDFTGLPTKIAPPVGGLQDQGSVPGQRIPAQGLNYVVNLICLWIQYLSGILTGTREVSPLGGTPYTAGAGVATPTTPNAGTQKVHLAVGLFGSGDAASWFKDFVLPLGFKITGVRAKVTVGGNANGGILDVYTNTSAGSVQAANVASAALGLITLDTGAINIPAAAFMNITIGVFAVGSVGSGCTVDIWSIEVDTAPQ